MFFIVKNRNKIASVHRRRYARTHKRFVLHFIDKWFALVSFCFINIPHRSLTETLDRAEVHQCNVILFYMCFLSDICICFIRIRLVDDCRCCLTGTFGFRSVVWCFQKEHLWWVFNNYARVRVIQQIFVVFRLLQSAST